MLAVFSSVRRGYEGSANRLDIRDNRHSDSSHTEVDR
jgi:hypothetical protein